MDIRFEWVDKEQFIFKAIIARHKKVPINIFLKFYDECCPLCCPLNRDIPNPIDGKLKCACVICRLKFSEFKTFCEFCKYISDKYDDELRELYTSNPLLDDFDSDNIGPVYHKNQWNCIKRYMINNDT